MTLNQMRDLKFALSMAKKALDNKGYYASRAQQCRKKEKIAEAERFQDLADACQLAFDNLKVMEGVSMFETWSKFCKEVFSSDFKECIEKLKEEVSELETEPIQQRRVNELADVILVCFAFCSTLNIDSEFLLNAVSLKMDINLSSKWIKQPNGTFKRVKK